MKNQQNRAPSPDSLMRDHAYRPAELELQLVADPCDKAGVACPTPTQHDVPQLPAAAAHNSHLRYP